MTDVQEQQTEAPATEAKTEKVVVDKSHPCLCSQFELVDPTDTDAVFQPECGQTTKGTFAQGHDARLVSFLVDGVGDGLAIRRVVDGVATSYATPAEALAPVSEPLKNKAEAATKNAEAKRAAKEAKAQERQAAKDAKAKEKAEKAAAKEAAAAAKANAPKATGAEVVAGSAEGDVAPLAEGQIKIKVGRWEYNATKLPDGGVQFVNGKGETEVRAEGDGYTVLQG